MHQHPGVYKYLCMFGGFGGSSLAEEESSHTESAKFPTSSATAHESWDQTTNRSSICDLLVQDRLEWSKDAIQTKEVLAFLYCLYPGT